MRLTKTLLACALALSTLPSFADALLSFEVGDAGAPNGSTPTVDAPPMLLDGTSFGGFGFNGNGAWLTTSAPAGCSQSGVAGFFTHAADATHAGGGCGALQLTSALDLADVDGLPHDLVISSPFGFTSFEFWWSTKGGNFTVKFMNAAGVVESPSLDHGGNDSCTGNVIGDHCTWHLETVNLAKAATSVVFSYGTDDAFAMIDDLKFIAPRDGNVPEPASLALTLGALAALGLRRRSTKQS